MLCLQATYNLLQVACVSNNLSIYISCYLHKGAITQLMFKIKKP